MIKTFSILIICFSGLFAFGQKRELDSTALESFADKFLVKLNLETNADSYFSEGFQEGPPLNYQTNDNYILSVSLDFEIIGISIGFIPSFFPGNDDNDLKGESTFIDIKPRLAFKNWLQTFQYRKVSGYYIENTQDFIPGWEEGEDPYILLPDLSNTRVGMSTSFILNPNFSYKNLFFQTEWQKKSAGSFIPSLDYSYNVFSFTLDETRYRDRSWEVRLAAAYFYTWVIGDNWFIAPNISPSIGVSFSKEEIENSNASNIQNTSYLTTSLESGLQLGYASKNIIFGVVFSSDFYWYSGEENRFIENNRIYGKLYFGYRFNSPSFIAKPYNKFAKKVGI